MLTNIEFYMGPDGAVYVKPLDKPVYTYDMECREITQEMLLRIRDLYPEAFRALSEIYSKSSKNRGLFEYKLVHRFIRCNFGDYDSCCDIGAAGSFNFEEVKCPLRGECIYERVICKPTLQSNLSEREKEVVEYLREGMSHQEVADELGLSLYTIRRHVANIKSRLGVSRTMQIIAVLKKNGNS